MAAYDIEQQEQLSELNLFWQRYGKIISAVLTGALVVTAGWQAYNWRAKSQSQEAAVAFSALQDAIAAKDAAKTKAAAGQLLEKYPGTLHAALGALVSAKAALDAGDTATAKVQLSFAVEKSRDEGIRDIATLRLASLLLDEKAYDDALKQLARTPQPTFAPRFLDLKGDVLAASGKPTEARSAWTEAVAKIDTLQKTPGIDARLLSNLREMLAAKLESAGAAK